MNKDKKKKTVRRELIEWGIIIGIGAFLYLTGLHTQVIGTIQRLVLETGIIRPSISGNGSREADYNFSLVDANEQVLQGKDLEGKVVFINFWATWCPPCIAELPDIHDLYIKFHGEENIRFIMISMDEDFEKAKRFIDKKKYSFDIYHFASAIPDAYTSQVIPTTFVLSPGGKIVVRKEGMAKYDTDSFRGFLRSML